MHIPVVSHIRRRSSLASGASKFPDLLNSAWLTQHTSLPSSARLPFSPSSVIQQPRRPPTLQASSPPRLSPLPSWDFLPLLLASYLTTLSTIPDAILFSFFSLFPFHPSYRRGTPRPAPPFPTPCPLTGAPFLTSQALAHLSRNPPEIRWKVPAGMMSW